MSSTHDLCWKIPSGLNLESFLKRNPPVFKYKIDHFYYIIDSLTRGMDLEDLDNNAGYINLNAKTLQDFNHAYKKYINYLVEERLILCDNKYVKGAKSLGYRINIKNFDKATIQEIPISDFVIKKRFTRERKAENAALKKNFRKYNYLTRWFNPDLAIDVGAALKKVEELFPPQTGGIKGPIKGRPSKSSKRFKAIYSINKLATQDYYYSVDDNVGRFHSNLTNIKKELRHFITYKGQKLVNIDVKNAQPLFSTLLLTKGFYNSKNPYLNIHNLQYITSHKSISTINKTHSSFSPYIKIVKALQKADNQDITEYINFVNSGEFYRKISELIYPNKPFDKEPIKKMIYTIFFSNNRFIGQRGAEAKREFKRHFPSVYEVFKLIKKNNHQSLAILLQRIESTIMIKNASLRISKEKPDLPIFSVHDSIATIVGNEDYVTNVIKEETLKLTGLNAMLGREYWG